MKLRIEDRTCSVCGRSISVLTGRAKHETPKAKACIDCRLKQEEKSSHE